jgi:hypothetical protein
MPLLRNPIIHTASTKSKSLDYEYKGYKPVQRSPYFTLGYIFKTHRIIIYHLGLDHGKNSTDCDSFRNKVDSMVNGCLSNAHPPTHTHPPNHMG